VAICPLIVTILQADQQNITLTLRSELNDFSDMLGVCLEVDKNKISQVIRNLGSNALKFTPANGTVDVVLTFIPEVAGSRAGEAEEDDLGESGKLVVAVIDSGVGLTAVSHWCCER
jgi:signal transduction histidine kinase